MPLIMILSGSLLLGTRGELRGRSWPRTAVLSNRSTGHCTRRDGRISGVFGPAGGDMSVGNQLGVALLAEEEAQIKSFISSLRMTALSFLDIIIQYP